MTTLTMNQQDLVKQDSHLQERKSSNIFVCPYNAYHKQYDYRKFQFHTARCKDRRGKVVYKCQFSPLHFFTSIPSLLDHEKTCENRQVETKDEDQCMDYAGLPGGEAENSNRKPALCYCSYDLEHVFDTLEQREQHEAICPKRGAFQMKYEHSQQVYQKHKA